MPHQLERINRSSSGPRYQLTVFWQRTAEASIAGQEVDPACAAHAAYILTPLSLSVNYKPSRSVKLDGWIRAQPKHYLINGFAQKCCILGTSRVLRDFPSAQRSAVSHTSCKFPVGGLCALKLMKGWLVLSLCPHPTPARISPN